MFIVFLFISNQVWYLIVSIRDLCHLSYFVGVYAFIRSSMVYGVVPNLIRICTVFHAALESTVLIEVMLLNRLENRSECTILTRIGFNEKTDVSP